MKFKPGDDARIVNSLRESNLNKEVLVTQYIGFFSKDEKFYFRDIPCAAPISDHYWWVDMKGDELECKYGPTHRVYIPELWLEPIVTTTLEETESVYA